ncbi:Chaperone protein DnaJ [Leucoagaricus sp. SymC.cos]|nr:Chaperone protein DnaJ [Leucoagaricus sp. SymC.cos]
MPHYQSLYDILGISKSASPDEVRKAYRKKALETHPDRLGPDASAASRRAAEAQFHLIHNAFETLSDSHRRKAYDAWGSKVDPKASMEESAKRKEDRNAWANNLKAEYERRKVSRSYTAPPLSSPSSMPQQPRYPSMLYQPMRPSVPYQPKPLSTANRQSRAAAPTTSKSKQQPPRPQEPPTPISPDGALSDQEEKIIAEMLQEIRAHLPPDYEERRRRALQKKADRERAEGRRRTVPV